SPIAVVASLRALLEHTIPPEDLARRGRTLRAGDMLSWQETATWLFDLGYEPVTEVSEPGTFSRRGGIVDIYPASAEQPARVELFGDEIETLRAFDPVTQRSQAGLPQLDVLPAREFSLERAAELGLAHDALEAQAEERRDELAELGLAVSVFPPPYVPRSRIDELAARHGAARMRPAVDALRLGWTGATSYAGRLAEFIEHVA